MHRSLDIAARTQCLTYTASANVCVCVCDGCTELWLCRMPWQVLNSNAQTCPEKQTRLLRRNNFPELLASDVARRAVAKTGFAGVSGHGPAYIQHAACSCTNAGSRSLLPPYGAPFGNAAVLKVSNKGQLLWTTTTLTLLMRRGAVPLDPRVGHAECCHVS